MSQLILKSNQEAKGMNDNFQELKALHTAIKDIDRIISGTKHSDDSMLEDVLFAVKDINKSQYGKEYVDTIIASIRSALLNIYTDKLTEINSDISIDISLDTSRRNTSVDDRRIEEDGTRA